MIKPTKTPQELDRIAQAVNSMLSEIYDDFVVVGFVAGTGQPLQVTQFNDEKGRYALESALSEVDLTSTKDDEANTGS